MHAQELKLKRIGADVMARVERESECDPYQTAQVFLEALDLAAYKFQIEHNDIEYDHFKSRVIEQIDRVRGIIATAKP